MYTQYEVFDSTVQDAINTIRETAKVAVREGTFGFAPDTPKHKSAEQILEEERVRRSKWDSLVALLNDVYQDVTIEYGDWCESRGHWIRDGRIDIKSKCMLRDLLEEDKLGSPLVQSGYRGMMVMVYHKGVDDFMDLLRTLPTYLDWEKTQLTQIVDQPQEAVPAAGGSNDKHI